MLKEILEDLRHGVVLDIEEEENQYGEMITTEMLRFQGGGVDGNLLKLP